MGRRSHLKELELFGERLSKNLPLQKMILFGSRAKGNASRYSDFDLLLVSSAFNKKASLDRPIGLYKKWTLDYPVDFLCYTPEEFHLLKKKPTLVREAVEEGIEINF